MDVLEMSGSKEKGMERRNNNNQEDFFFFTKVQQASFKIFNFTLG